LRTFQGRSSPFHFILFAYRLRQFEFLQMSSDLNSYRNFINIQNKEGQSLVSNAIDKFISPLAGDECILLLGKDLQQLKDNLL
jgi:hypothetical protein